MEKIRELLGLCYCCKGDRFGQHGAEAGCDSHQSALLVVAESQSQLNKRAKEEYEQEKKQTKSLTKQLSTSRGVKKGKRGRSRSGLRVEVQAVHTVSEPEHTNHLQLSWWPPCTLSVKELRVSQNMIYFLSLQLNCTLLDKKPLQSAPSHSLSVLQPRD